MNKEKSPMDHLDRGRGEKSIRALESRKKSLLERKNQVTDSFVSRHIDVLLLEVEDLIAKYDQSGPARARTNKGFDK
jgi:hypothetical protein